MLSFRLTEAHQTLRPCFFLDLQAIASLLFLKTGEKSLLFIYLHTQYDTSNFFDFFEILLLNFELSTI